MAAENDFASKLNDNGDHSLNRVPVEVAINALQAQVKELQQLAAAAQLTNGNETTNTADAEEVEELRKQVKELEKANAKAEYRIQFLLRALDERDNRQQQ
ncbi:predicted protein [Lichtheimia corymbifera JMRC:FSU:9682]|uniref:Uncharacterized protein n=1 Tax=Lichtheimia corymbifera JMRC:FSU:9682 TaxID=1263082 RepID=A0A068SEP5_9FUNG|nr:predicted protein [Lichtheimia corymbifera JMRC:FSU:9682]